MGWWKSDGPETGCIAGQLPSGHPGEDTPEFRNAIPGRDSPDDCYNGDGPADVMGNALAEISALYKKHWARPAKADELRACFNFCLNGRIRGGKTEAGPEAGCVKCGEYDDLLDIDSVGRPTAVGVALDVLRENLRVSQNERRMLSEKATRVLNDYLAEHGGKEPKPKP